MNTFIGYHPIVNFTFFVFVILFSMIFMHPICLGISFVCAFVYSAKLNGIRSLKFNILYILPMMIGAALLNPVFNHGGVTILMYLPSGNPLTLESIIYGVAAATMLAAVICWFSCYNEVMTSDKFIYLFGRLIPSLSLIISMALRFVPRFKEQIKVISDAQKCVGRDMSSGNIINKAKNGITILSILVTWALENAIETADSMKSRGYGLKSRTAFSIFTFDKRDKIAITFIGVLGLYVVFGSFYGGVYFRYFPSVKGVEITPYSISVFCAYFMLCITPVMIEFWEDKKWKALKSSI